MGKGKKTAIGFFTWFVAFLVPAVLGLALINGSIMLPDWIGGEWAELIAGWALVITAVMMLFQYLKKFF